MADTDTDSDNMNGPAIARKAAVVVCRVSARSIIRGLAAIPLLDAAAVRRLPCPCRVVERAAGRLRPVNRLFASFQNSREWTENGRLPKPFTRPDSTAGWIFPEYRSSSWRRVPTGRATSSCHLFPAR